MNETTNTKYGPAAYTINAAGTLAVFWTQGLVLNGVQYSSASAYQERPAGGRTTPVFLNRTDLGNPTLAAELLIAQEMQRLSALLVTFEAVRAVRIRNARAVIQTAEQKVLEAHQTLEAAWAELEEAQAAVAPQHADS